MSEFASPDQSADWLFDVEQRFYNDVYADGSPPAGEGCEWAGDVTAAGVELTARWCWAQGEFPVLVLRTDDIGVTITWFGTPN